MEISPPGLDDETQVLPGHKEETTVGDERRSNPFIRAWLDGEGLFSEACRVNGEEATLLLWAPDYDGGNKALVRLGSGHENADQSDVWQRAGSRSPAPQLDTRLDTEASRQPNANPKRLGKRSRRPDSNRGPLHYE
jgi:hypothetical protein